MGVEPTSPAWKAGTFADRPRARKAEGERVELSRLIARPLSGRLPSPVGLTFHNPSCGGRNRTCAVTLNRRPPVPTQAPPQSKSGRRELNPRSRAPEARGIPGFPTSCSSQSAQRELNPHFRHGKAAGCRYIMGALKCAGLSKNQEHREGVEPTLPRYECGVLAAGRPVLVVQWDQRGSNPHLAD